MRARRAGCVALFFLVGALFGALALPSAAGAQALIEAELATSFAETLPGQPVTLSVRVDNVSAQPVTFDTRLSLPRGWRALIAPGLVSLEPGEGKALLISILPPSVATAGLEQVGIVFESPLYVVLAEVFSTVSVRLVQDLSVHWVNPPSYVIAGPYQVEYVVQNLSNVEQTISVHAEDRAGFTIHGADREFTLAPGDAAAHTVEVQVPREITGSVEQLLRVRARVEGAPDVTAGDTVTVQVVPRQLSESAAYHFYPLRLSLESRRKASEAGSTFSWQLTGRGPITDRDPGVLRIAADADRAQLVYERREYRISAGSQGFLLSPMSLAATGNGIDVRGSFDAWSLQALHVTESDGTQQMGARASYQLSPLIDVAANYAVDGGEDARLWSVQSGVRLGPLPVALAVEYGVERQGEAPGREPSGLRLDGQLVGGPVAGRFSWTQHEEGFGDEDEPTTRAGLAVNVPVGESLLVTFDARSERQYEDRLFGGLGEFSRTVRTGIRSSAAGWQLELRGGESLLPKDGELDRSNSRGLRYARTVRGEGERVFFHSLTWNQEQETDETDVVYDASFRTQDTGMGVFIPRLRLTFPEQRLDVGVRWQRELSARTNLLASVDMDAVGDDAGYNLSAEFRYRTIGDATWRFQAREKIASGERNVEAFVSLVTPIEFPVGLRSGIGRFRGRVLDRQGDPVSGLIVRLNEQITTTNGAGEFYFPAVPEGTLYLTMRTDQVAADLITLPTTPYRLDLKSGEEKEEEFRIIRGGTITGRIELVSGGDAGTAAGTVAGDPTLGEVSVTAFAQGMVATVRGERGAVVQRRVTSSGDFYFDGLPPGTWEFDVSGGSLPANYRIEGEHQALQVGSGDAAEVVVRIVPVIRRIQFIQQGTVVGESDEE